MTIIKFEARHDDLKDFHQFLYNKDNTLNVEEEYQTTPGVHKAPDVTALILTIGSTIAVPIVIEWIKSYYNYKKSKLKISKKTKDGFVEIDNIDELE